VVKSASTRRPTAAAEWALLAVRITGVLFGITLGGIGLVHTFDASFDPVRWPLLWALYGAVPLAAAIIGWPRDGRPAELRFLTGALASFLAMVTVMLALIDPWYFPAAAMSGTALFAALAMRPAEWRP
jgi:hypothetical protein